MPYVDDLGGGSHYCTDCGYYKEFPAGTARVIKAKSWKKMRK